MGISINTITLGGFAIAIGVVVDDAIIDVENILRRLRENSASAQPRSLFQVVLDASLEVRSAVVYATFIVALVFLPVLMMGGVEGRLFAPLGISFILATLASLGVALTVTPALCYVILSKAAPRAEPDHVRRLKARHRRWLEGVSRRPRTVMVTAAILCLGAVATLPFFGGEFLPDLHEGHYIIHMATAPGTSLAESIRLGKRVTAQLLQDPYVRSVSQEAGRAENGEDIAGPQSSEFHVELQPLKGEDPDVRGKRNPRPAEAISRRDVFHRIAFGRAHGGNDFRRRRRNSSLIFLATIWMRSTKRPAEVRQVLEKIPGAVDVNLTAQPGLPEMAVRLRPERLLQYGFRPVEVLDAIQTAYEGTIVSQIYRRQPRLRRGRDSGSKRTGRIRKPSARCQLRNSAGNASCRCANWPTSN